MHHPSGAPIEEGPGAEIPNLVQNSISAADVADLLQSEMAHLRAMKADRYTRYAALRDYVERGYSWRRAAALLTDYLKAVAAEAKPASPAE